MSVEAAASLSAVGSAKACIGDRPGVLCRVSESIKSFGDTLAYDLPGRVLAGLGQVLLLEVLGSYTDEQDPELSRILTEGAAILDHGVFPI